MKSCLLSPKSLKKRKDKTNKSSQILDDLSKFETSEYFSPLTSRSRKKKRKVNKSHQIYEDSCQFHKRSHSSKKKSNSKRTFHLDPLQKTEEKLKKIALKEKLKKTKEKFMKKNSSKKNLDFKHPLPWGADQRIFNRKKTSENEMKIRMKTDRDPSRRAQRKEIGLDLYSKIKVKSKTMNKSEEKPKEKRSPDPLVLNYMRQKKKNERLLKIKTKIQESLKEKERIKALANLEKTQLKKLKKKKKKKTRVLNDEEKSTDPAGSVYKKGESEDEKKIIFSFDNRKNDRFLGKVLIIQRWFRGIRLKFKAKKDRLSEEKSFFLDDESRKNFEQQKEVKKIEKLSPMSICNIKQTKKLSYDNREKVLTENKELESLNSDSLDSIPDSRLGEVFENKAGFQDESDSDQDSSSSIYLNAESSLKQILEKQVNEPQEVPQQPDRPAIVIVDKSDSSEEEWNANQVIIHADTTISEQALESLEFKQRYFLKDYDQELKDLFSTEIDSFLSVIPFKERKKEIDPSSEFVQMIAKIIFQVLGSDPKSLDFIDSEFSKKPEKFKFLQRAKPIFCETKDLISAGTRNEIKFIFGGNQLKDIYNEMVIDSVNEAMNLALSAQADTFCGGLESSQKLSKNFSLEDLKFKTLQVLKTWTDVKNGIFPNTQNPEFSKLEKIREEKLSFLLSVIIKNTEHLWLVYENEETQAKTEISKLVFESLLEETYLILFSDC